MSSEKNMARKAGPFRPAVATIEPEFDPTRCTTCGKLWLTPDGEWRVCVDCPRRTIIDIPTPDTGEVEVYVDLKALVRFLQTALNRLRKPRY